MKHLNLLPLGLGLMFAVGLMLAPTMLDQAAAPDPAIVCFAGTQALNDIIPFVYFAALVLLGGSALGTGIVAYRNGGLRSSMASVTVAMIVIGGLVGGSSVVNVAEAATTCLLRDGSLAMTGNLDMGTYNVTNAGTIATSSTSTVAGMRMNDNVLSSYGTAADATIFYNGTNLVIDPNAVGSGDLRLDGNLTFTAASTVGTAAGALTLQPLAGQGLNVTLATTGDFKVNSTQLVVDTNAARVGVGTAAPASLLDVSGASPEIRVSDTTVAHNYVYGIGLAGTDKLQIVDRSTGFTPFTMQASGAGAETVVTLDPYIASAGLQTKDVTINLNDRYWTGASTTWGAYLKHDMIATTPTSALILGINGVDILNVGSSKNVGIGTVAFPSAGTNGLYFATTTPPTTIGAGTAGLFASSTASVVELWAVDASGNYTQLSTHPADVLAAAPPACPFPWALNAFNPFLGLGVTVDWCAVILDLEAATGKQYMKTYAVEQQDWDTVENTRREQVAAQRAAMMLERDAMQGEIDKLWVKYLAAGNDPALQTDLLARIEETTGRKLDLAARIPPAYVVQPPPQWLQDRGVVTAIGR